MAPNVLEREFEAAAPNQKWVVDTKPAASQASFI
jgi:hypothetical protein